jgi:hypothetical protein
MDLLPPEVPHHLLHKPAPLLHALAQRLDEPFEPLAPLGLGAGLILGRDRGCDGQPEAHEEGEGLGGDALVAFQPGDLAGEAVEPAGQRGSCMSA